MSDWSDEFYKMNDTLKSCAIDSVKTVLAKKSTEVKNYLQTATPRKTGGLVESLKRNPIESSGGKVGYKIIFDGYNQKGAAHQMIANALNAGFFVNQFTYIPGSHFMDKAVALLKGMDEEIDKEFEKKVAERTR